MQRNANMLKILKKCVFADFMIFFANFLSSENIFWKYCPTLFRLISNLYIARLSTKWQYKKNPHRSETMGIGIIWSSIFLLRTSATLKKTWHCFRFGVGWVCYTLAEHLSLPLGLGGWWAGEASPSSCPISYTDYSAVCSVGLPSAS